ncbi:MAG: SDR family NAD(P)-dependent oxidoreductase [candidate division Zixibacteria bacterium]|nr:SDR family NAD(P)-dependent oxidoreductase [candidate division Zixibacteria bacterium]
MVKLNDNRVLITGASAGIGAACARAFAEQGAKLLLIARRGDRLRELSDQLTRDHKTECLCVEFDLRQHLSIPSMLEQVPDEWRAIDVLVNNAGLARGVAKLHEGDLDDWDEMIDVNVKALLAVSRTVIPWMLKRQAGHVINIGSIAGHEAYPGGNVYCATKFAVRALSRGMKMDLTGTPIRVTSIDPGLVETEFSKVRFKGDTERAKLPYKGIIPLTGEDIAEAVVWSAMRPAHVNITEMVIFPTAQSSSTLVHREEKA